MNAIPVSADANDHAITTPLPLLARCKRLRVLAWEGRTLYASRGYNLLRCNLSPEVFSRNLPWLPVASFRPVLWRRATVTTNLTARLCRDGFHALAVLPSGGVVGAIPGAIVALRPSETDFRMTRAITRGTRPLHITAVPTGTVFWGEYFDNPARDEVHIYASEDGGLTWQVAYTFPKGAVRHVHNIVHDPWGDCLWVLTGDYGNECRVIKAARDFSQVDIVLQGNQQTRSVAVVPTEDGVYFSSDTPLEANFIYHLDRAGKLSRRTSISSSSIYGCRVGRDIFFSTMVEPSRLNTDRHVRIYCGRDGQNWRPVLAWEKDRWPMRLFQYGNAFLPDGNNSSPYLAVTTVAVKSDDYVTCLYSVAG
jgi:hypothetical protein